MPSLGEVHRRMPKPEEFKNLVRYKGPTSNQVVLKQAATNSELQKAVEIGDVNMAQAILRYGTAKRCVNVNAPLWPKRERLLHLAAQKGFRDMCLLLLEANAEIDAEEISDGKQPLHEACKHGHFDVCELLLDRKARIEEANFQGLRPLHWAAANGHVDICDMLLDRRAILQLHPGTPGSQYIMQLLLVMQRWSNSFAGEVSSRMLRREVARKPCTWHVLATTRRQF